ncbi:DUF3376 domain-containing protein [Kocuria sabuli]|uniref:DUF3376 domain-containing protein n=1 Tax=Kocuria sabuli TaxID=3071448 RepID=UPI0034D41B87
MSAERAGTGPGRAPERPGPRLTVLPPDRRLAEATAGRPPAFGRTLRFALAMRGGVSLAVWIGGTVAELDLLRRIRIHRDPSGELHAYLLHPAEAPGPRAAERARVYAGLLADAGYDRVEFDLLAGASAGGLNGVVHAVAQRAGTGMGPLGLLWEEHAGLGRLLRPLGTRPVDSLLQGDAYLWPRLQELLLAVHAAAGHHPDLVAEHVSVDLSATVLDSDPSPHSGAAEGRGGFHFTTPEPGSPAPRLGNAIPARPGADGGSAPETPEEAAFRAASLARLAYAARATSSFPGAFEPASVWSAPTEGRLGGHPLPDLSHAFSAHRTAEELPFRVIDGGIFDNVPIDRAVAAAGARTSLRHADRCLLYLDPDPPAPQEVRSGDLDLPRLVRTLGATVSRLRRRETGDDEVLALSDRRDARLLADGRLHSLAALAGAWDPVSVEERRRAYVRFRARADAARLGHLLTRPAQWQLTSTLPRREQARARRPTELDPLRAQLAQRYGALSRGPLTDPDAAAVLCGPQALADAASCVLTWVRFLESLALGPGAVPAPLAGLDPAPARARAYRVLAAAGHARDRLFAAVLEACEDPAAPVTAAVPAWLDDRSPVPGAGGEAWRELDAVVAELRGVHTAVEAHLGTEDRAAPAPGRREGPEEAWRTTWRESPWSTVPGTGPGPGAADLPPLLAAAGIPTAVSGITYGEIRGDRAPARPVDLGTLPRSWAEQRLQRALDATEAPRVTDARLREILAPDTGRLPAQDKLAGAGLLNFRGFLAAEWRANDWWWGRLDAAAGAAAFLRGLPARPDRAAPAGPAEDVPAGPGPARDGSAAHGRAEHEQTEPAPAASNPVQDGPVEDGTAPEAAAVLQESLLAELGDGNRQHALAVLGAGGDRLARLAPGYRLSLASRGLRVLGRALAGTPDLPRGVWELLLFALQPVLVLAPLLLAPVRAALALVVAAVGLALLRAPDSLDGAGSGGLAAAAAAALLALSLLRTARRTRRRWSRVLEAAAGAPPAAFPVADTGPGPGTLPDPGTTTHTGSVRDPGTVPQTRAGTGSGSVSDARPAPDPGTLALVRTARDAARRRAGACAAAAAALLLPAAAAATGGHTPLAVLLLAGALGLERCAAAVALRVPGREPVDEVVRAAVVVLAAVAAWALAALVAGPLPAPVPAGGPALLVPAGVLAVLGALALTGFLRPGWAVLVTAAAAAAGTGALWVAGSLTGHHGAGLAAAVLGWAAVLWWSPRNGMLRAWEPADELLPPGPGRERG